MIVRVELHTMSDCSVVFCTLVGVFVFSVMRTELLMTSAISCPLSVVVNVMVSLMSAMSPPPALCNL